MYETKIDRSHSNIVSKKIFFLFAYWLIQIFFFKDEFLGVEIQLFLLLYTSWIIIENWNLFFSKRQSFRRKDQLTQIAVNILLVLLPVFSAYKISINTYPEHFLFSFTAYLSALITIPICFLWSPLSQLFTNTEKFLARYCGVIELMIIMLVSSIPVISPVTILSNYSELFSFYKWIALFYFDIVLLVLFNLISVTTSKWGSRIALMQSVLNFFLYFAQMMLFKSELVYTSLALTPLTIPMLISVVVTQTFLAASFSDKND